MRRDRAGDYVARCASLATLLEVSAYPKPGNVHRTRDYPDTTYEHFLAGSVAMGPAMRLLALCGYDASSSSIQWEEIGVGRAVMEATTESIAWQRGGNVNLGIILLFSPLAAAAGATLYQHDEIDPLVLRKYLREVVKSTTPEDSLHLYAAINLAMTPRTLGKAEELDVSDKASKDRILSEGITPPLIFRICMDRDTICREWVTNFELTFETGLPYLKRALEDTGEVNISIVDTFLLILSETTDSLITRKSGVEKAKEVSQKAMKVLESGGAGSLKGLEMLQELDEELHAARGDLNPGTTADLTATSIFVALLEGWRP
jgi:triphosphoribosyl-dephospho-CoA synthase